MVIMCISSLTITSLDIKLLYLKVGWAIRWWWGSKRWGIGWFL